MAQLFNSQGQQPHTSPPPNGVQGQIYRRKPKSRLQTKISVVIAGMLLIIGLPLSMLLSRQQQLTQQNAQVYQNSKHDSCNKLTIVASESPACPRLNGHGKQNITSYTWTADIRSNDGKSHTVTLTQYSDFCTGPYATGNPSQCDKNPIIKNITVNTPYTLVIQRSPTIGNACGTYQADLHISSIDNNANCTYSGKDIGASGLCETGVACEAVSPTPTPRLTLTPTEKPTLTPTACITPGRVQNVKVTCANCSSSQ